MKILFLADVFPFPVISGGRLRTFNILKQLSKDKKEIDFLCLNESVVEKKDIDYIKNFANKFDYVELQKKKWYLRALNLATFSSDKFFLTYSKEFANLVDSYLEQNKYDVVFCDSIWLYQYIYNNSKINRNNTKLVLGIHNVEHEIIYRMIKGSESKAAKYYGVIEYKKILKNEIKYINDSDKVFVVSERDKNVYDKLINLPSDKVDFINNGIDIEIADNYKKFDNVEKEKWILFIGSLWYRPNYEGISWFVEEIWPEVIKIHPHLKLKIIGKYDKNIVKNGTGVEYLGFVDDIYEYYKKGICSIVPLKIGSGTRLKILEAMSFKVPVISTTIGCEGIDVTDKKDILIADTTEKYIEYINSLLNNEYQELGENEYNLVKKDYDWNIIGDKMNKILVDL